MPSSLGEWLHFDVHGRIGIRVAANAPAAMQLQTMLAAFASGQDVPDDIVVSAPFEPMPDAAVLEDELAYSEDAVRFMRDRVQICVDGERFRIHGPGELLTALVPVLDRAMVTRRAAMIHAATVGYRGHAVAMPAAGGTGKTSTVAKLLKREGFSFMGDDWAFLDEGGELLGYEKPMFIKPHHRGIYPHLFEGRRKPLVPSSMSRGVGHLTTLVHPYVVRYPRLAHASRRWSPEHRMVTASQALPGCETTRSAPLLLAVFVERYHGARTRRVEVDPAWMVDRILGNFHIEMAGFSQHVVTALGATSLLSTAEIFEQKAAVLTKALDGRPCYLLQVPSVYSADLASDDIVASVAELVASADPAQSVVRA